MEPQELSTLEVARNHLTPRERTALEKYEKSSSRAPLALDTALAMYDLFLNGHSYEEIQRVNKKAGRPFQLGQIIDAGIRYEWAERRLAHQQVLFDSIALKVKQVQMESVSFATDLIAAAHKQYGERIKEYLQTGDEMALGDLKITSLKAYQEVVQMMLKMTGQDKPDPKGGGTQVNIINPGSAEVKTGTPSKRLTGAEMFKLLELVDGGPDDGI